MYIFKKIFFLTFYLFIHMLNAQDLSVDISNLWFNKYSKVVDFHSFLCEDNINVRIAPTTDSPIITSLPIGKKVYVKEITNENFLIKNINFPWVKVEFLNKEGFFEEGYLVAKFLTGEGWLYDQNEEDLFLLCPKYNYEQQYQIKIIKNNKEISKINLSNMWTYSSDSGPYFNFISNNIDNVKIIHVYWCDAVCGRSCRDEYVFWNGKKFYNASNDDEINLSHGWRFDKTKSKLVFLNNFFFYKGYKEIYYDDIDGFPGHGDFPQDQPEFDGKFYTEFISELIWDGQKLKKTNTETELVENLQKKSNKWYFKGDLYSGYIIENWTDGTIKNKKTIKKGLEEGVQFEFYEDGKIKCITNWSQGKWNGTKIWYLKSGLKNQEKEYLDWKEVSVVDIEDISLDLKEEPPAPLSPEIQVFELDLEIKEEIEFDEVDTEDEEEIEFEEEEDVDEVIAFAVVEGSPIFPGCKSSTKSNISDRKMEDQECFNKGVINHIRKNFMYPAIAKEMGIQEKIYVKFVIDKTGQIIDVKVVRGQDKYLKEEAIRLVKSLPKMEPARQRGKPVSVNYTIPISFLLN